jgi:hypothetical protein
MVALHVLRSVLPNPPALMIRICLSTVDLPLSPAPMGSCQTESCVCIHECTRACFDWTGDLPSSSSFTSRSALFLSMRKLFSISSFFLNSGSAGFLPKHMIAGAIHSGRWVKATSVGNGWQDWSTGGREGAVEQDQSLGKLKDGWRR